MSKLLRKATNTVLQKPKPAEPPGEGLITEQPQESQQPAEPEQKPEQPTETA